MAAHQGSEINWAELQTRVLRYYSRVGPSTKLERPCHHLSCMSASETLDAKEANDKRLVSLLLTCFFRSHFRSATDTAGQRYHRLQQRRIHVNEATLSWRFKLAYESKVQYRIQAAADKEIARAKSVSIIRKYREGDLPDIQIPYSDIIRPLQNLAEMDVEVGRMLFSKLVTALMGQVESHLDTVSQVSTW